MSHGARSSVWHNHFSSPWIFEKFSRSVSSFPEVVEFYRMSGDVDYLLRVVVPDIASYDEFYKRLIDHVDLTDVSSSFAMEEIKYTTTLPLDYAVSKESRTAGKE
jgi:Lrp/AsnC family transcriptional regulator